MLGENSKSAHSPLREQGFRLAFFGNGVLLGVKQLWPALPAEQK